MIIHIFPGTGRNIGSCVGLPHRIGHLPGKRSWKSISLLIHGERRMVRTLKARNSSLRLRTSSRPRRMGLDSPGGLRIVKAPPSSNIYFVYIHFCTCCLVSWTSQMIGFGATDLKRTTFDTKILIRGGKEGDFDDGIQRFRFRDGENKRHGFEHEREV